MTNPTSMKSTPTSLLSNANYNRLKLTAQLILPAIGTLYFALAQIWDFPAGEQVTGTVAALNVFAGVAIAFFKTLHDASGAKYDGTVDVKVSEDGSKQFLLNLNSDPDELDQKSEITFKVNSP